MDTHKLAIKLFLSDAVPTHTIVPLFHSWIQQQVMPDHLLIDVADYEHVAAGPGTVLVAHEANLHLDHGENRPGLLYVRKQPIPAAGSFTDRLRAVLGHTLQAAARLEQDLPQVKADTAELSIRINDRLHAPNTPELFEQLKPQVEAVMAELYYEPVELHQHGGPRELLDVRVKSTERPTIAELLDRLAPVRA